MKVTVVVRYSITAIALGALSAALACSSSESGDEATDREGGAACETDDQCASGHCTNGVCDTPGCPGGICVGTGGVDGSATGGVEDVDDARVQALRNAACAGWAGEPEPRSPILMFVVDVSTSMKQPDPSNPALTKWEVTQPVLLSALDTLPDSVAVGILLFPNLMTTPSQVERDSFACVQADALVPIDVLGESGSEQRQALASVLNMTPLDDSGTPTHDALRIALDELDRTPLLGSRYVVLLTDGQPTYSLNCVGDGLPEHAVDEEPIIEEVGSALGDAIGTFVIGAPGSEQTVKVGADARQWLSRAAEAGGTPQPDCSHDGGNYCHFDMVAEVDYSEGLARALLEIAEQVVPCDYSLPTPPAGLELDPENVNVVFKASSGAQKLLLRDDSPSCTEGWYWSEDQTRVMLCPDSCRELRLDRSSSLLVLFGCKTETVEIR